MHAAAATTSRTVARPWSELEEHYRRAPAGHAGLAAMLRLVQDVGRSRFAASLRAWTSHWDLCVAQPSADADAAPHLRISPLAEGGGGKLALRYVDTTVLNRQWHREVEGELGFEALARFLEQLHWFG